MNKFTAYQESLFSHEKLAAIFASPLQGMELLDKLKANMIPVKYSACKLEQFVEEHHEYLIVPFMLYKDREEDLLLSTSSMHMNWLWPNLLYVPVNIKNNDSLQLRQVYEVALAHENVIFFNHTIPHKSNPVMQEMFGQEYGDYLCRVGSSFKIADGNGQAFVRMTRELYKGEIDFSQATVVIVGVGGAGGLAAKAIIKEQPKRLILADIRDVSEFAKELGAEFYQGIEKIPDLAQEKLVIIDATAHFEDGIQRGVALDLVEKYDDEGNVFIDYNMNTQIGAYDYLKSSAGVGREYVAVTNYIMVLEIIKTAASAGITLPPVTNEVFQQKVLESVQMRDRIKGVKR